MHAFSYVYLSSTFDDSKFVCNIGHFYARLIELRTDYQLYKQKESKEIVRHKLTPVQLNAATQIRSTTSYYRKRADEGIKVIGQQHIQSFEILRLLTRDDSIMITRPGKGRRVVVIKKSDYIGKMKSILQDQSTFTFIDHNPTLVSEDRLIRLLLRINKEGFITNDEYNLSRPVGSRPARLYGLPKLHKLNYRLRVISYVCEHSSRLWFR